MATDEMPLVTFALFAYNQELFIQEAVESALSQVYSPLEVIISDDCSVDNTFEIIKTVVSKYDGPHIVKVMRNEINVGLASHINKINHVSSGEIVIAAAGDDISYPQRVRTLVDRWVASGKKECSLFSAMDEIDSRSFKTGKIYRSNVDWELVNPHKMLARNIGVFGAAHAWSIRVPRNFPPMISTVINEDHVIPFRSSLRDGIYYIDDALVGYRANIGLASNFGEGVLPKACAARQSILTRRPYIVYVQKVADLKFVGGDSLRLTKLAKSRRSDYLFRYWLTAGRNWSLNRLIYFARRSRFTWIARELWLHYVMFRNCPRNS